MNRRASRTRPDASVVSPTPGARTIPAQRVIGARNGLARRSHHSNLSGSTIATSARKNLPGARSSRQNRNPLLTMDIGADGRQDRQHRRRPAATGIVGSAVQNGQRLILAMYGMRNAKDRAEEARKGSAMGLSARSNPAFGPGKEGETVGTAPASTAAPASTFPLWRRATSRIRRAARGNTERLNAQASSMTGRYPAPVDAGRELARLKIYPRRRRWRSIMPLKAGESVPQSDRLYRRALRRFGGTRPQNLFRHLRTQAH